MSWDIYAPDLSARRKSDETSKLHPMSSESRQQHPCGISIYTAAGVCRSCTDRAGSEPLLLFVPFFPPGSSGCVQQHCGLTQGLQILLHIRGWLPQRANGLGKAHTGPCSATDCCHFHAHTLLLSSSTFVLVKCSRGFGTAEPSGPAKHRHCPAQTAISSLAFPFQPSGKKTLSLAALSLSKTLDPWLCPYSLQTSPAPPSQEMCALLPYHGRGFSGDGGRNGFVG